MIASMSAVTGAASTVTSLSNGLGGVNGSGMALAPMAGESTAPTPFGDLLTSAVGEVNQLQDQAKTVVTGLINGSGVDVHEAMISTQKASMAFELSLAVRNKAVQAYQQVMSMQF
jgi:flagellar hook-basal body complex protein FliE